MRMGGRAVEGTGLENRQACKRLVGSNPTPSASVLKLPDFALAPDAVEGAWIFAAPG
jgi:hypothetical protein